MMTPLMYYIAIHKRKIALVRKQRQTYDIERVKTLEQDQVPLDALKEMIGKKQGIFVSGLETSQILLRSFTLQLKGRREVKKALPFQIEQLFPHADEGLIALPALSFAKEATHVSLLASTSKHVESHLEKMSHSGLDPDVISCVPMALFRFCNHFYGKYDSLFVQCSEGALTTFVAIENGKLVGSQSHKTEDVKRAWDFLQKKYPTIVHCLHLSGPDLPEFLETIDGSTSTFTDYAIPIGLALDQAKNDRFTAQFRVHSLSKKEMRRLRSWHTRYFAAACLSLVLLLGGGFHVRHLYENKIVQQLGYEKNTRLKRVVESLQHQIQTQRKGQLSISSLPKVSHLLEWLSTHPTLADASVDQFNYELIKRPKLGSTTPAFSAKVDFRLECDSKKAREFHEALLKDKRLVDQQQGIKWDGDDGRYQISFFLKNRAGR